MQHSMYLFLRASPKPFHFLLHVIRTYIPPIFRSAKQAGFSQRRLWGVLYPRRELEMLLHYKLPRRRPIHMHTGIEARDWDAFHTHCSIQVLRQQIPLLFINIPSVTSGTAATQSHTRTNEASIL